MKYCIYKITKDNIPGFRDREEMIIKCFQDKKDAEEELKKYKNSSEFHEGYGAGSGTIDIIYIIKEEEK